MKTNILLAWRVLVAVGMVAIIFFVGLLTYEYIQEKQRHSPNDYYYALSKYSDRYQFEWHKNKVRVKSTETGKYLTPKLENIFDSYQIKDTLTVFFHKNKRGFLNVYTGQMVIPAQYDRAWIFSEGLGGVVKDNLLGFVNKKGETVIPCQFKWRTQPDNQSDYLFRNGYCAVLDSTNKWGFINTKGEWAVGAQYAYVAHSFKGYYAVVKNEKYGLLDSNLKELFPAEYDWIEPTTEGIIVRQQNSQKLYAYDGKTILQPFVYEDLSDIHYNSGKVNESGDDIYIKSDYMTFTIGDKVGLMNKNGKMVVPPIYQNIKAVGNELFSCRVAGYSYAVTINSKGEIVQ